MVNSFVPLSVVIKYQLKILQIIKLNQLNIATMPITSNIPTNTNIIKELPVGENTNKPQKSNPHNVPKHLTDKLYELISIWYPNTNGKITPGKLTGMFLQNHDEDRVKTYLLKQDKLKKKN
eukprot:515702_1